MGIDPDLITLATEHDKKFPKDEDHAQLCKHILKKELEYINENPKLEKGDHVHGLQLKSKQREINATSQRIDRVQGNCFHIGKSGKPCRAVRECPLGFRTEHYRSPAEAQVAADEKNAAEYSVLP